MSDVFLSYNREDHTIAQQFAQAFEREGLSVWWMPTLRSGETYDSATEKALRQAASVAVLWSRRSVDSQWVRAEATIAGRSGKLVPAMIEACDRPVAFELTQTADLTHWRGDPSDPSWRTYLADVRGVIEQSRRRAVTTGSENQDVAHTASQPALALPAAPRRVGALPLALLVLAVPALVAVFWLARRGWVETTESARATVSTPAPAAVTKPAASVAVMPFANLTGEEAKEYFSDGMAEELINALAKVPGLKVASRTSSFAYKGKNADVRQIARDLGVSTVLEGSVRSAGARIRVTAQLINAESGFHVWSQTYDRDFEDLFKLEDDLASEIVTAFKKTQNADLPTFESEGPPTRNLDAYALYLRALPVMSGAADSRLAEGYDLISRAIALDPGFARAYVVRATISSLGSTPLADIERDARKAIELDPANAAAGRATLAALDARRGNWVGAEELFAATTEGSNSPDFLQGHVLGTLWTVGHLRKAFAELSKAQRLAPAALAFNINLARLYSSLGDDVHAIQYTNIAIAMGADLKSRRTQGPLIDAAVRAGRFGEAADRLISTLPEDADRQMRDTFRLVYAAMEDKARRQAALAALDALMPKLHDRDWPLLVGAMTWYTQLGSLDGAYAAARRLQAMLPPEGITNAWAWLWNPELRPFRQDARFQPLVTSIGLMKYWERHGPPDGCDLGNGKLTCH